MAPVVGFRSTAAAPPRPPEPALTRLSAEQVRTLAPDAAVARAGEDLATPRRWSETGESGSAAWGLCQGSRATPYQVVIDLDGLAYSCSCPSRKNPCKHALGLLFLLADTPLPAGDATSTPAQAQPRWAAEWLADRAARAADANRPPADPVAQAKRIESRERKVAAGIEELDRWLGDLIRRGLDAARAGGYATWESMAARLVDAQAGGLARSVRGLGSMAGTIDAWPHLLLEGTARLHLLCEAYRRADELPAGLRADVRALVGWTTKEDDLGDADAEEDRWLVVGRRLDEGIQVMTARTWLLGEASGRIALHLAFGVDEAPPTPIAVPGRSFRATLAFYASATPLRAVVRPVLVPAGEVDGLPPGAGESVEAMLGNHAVRLATNPFLDSWPVLLAAAEPIPVQGGVVLRQAGSAESLPISAGPAATRLLATSGGHPVAVFGEWDGSQLRPVSAFAEGRFVDLEPGEMASSPTRDGIPTWPAMLSAALLGTERSGPLPDDITREAGLPAAPDDTPERRLLAAAAVATVRRRAGRAASRLVVDAPAPAPADARPPLVGEAAHLLGVVLRDEHALLPEFLDLIRASGRRLPDERVPELLDLGTGSETLRAAVHELNGGRVRWLLDVVPGFAAEVGMAADPEAWAEAVGASRRGELVRNLRRADADAARDLVAANLDDLPGDDRVSAVQGLAVGLSPADEPLLDRVLSDARKDVRRAAVELLARIPGSRLGAELEATARPLLRLRVRVRLRLSVMLPALDPELEAVGFGGRQPGGLGERAGLLRQLVGFVRPERWTEWLGLPAAALLEHALATEEAQPLVVGWLDATRRFGDEAWAEALLASDAVGGLAEGDRGRVLDALTEAEAAAVVTRLSSRIDLRLLADLAERMRRPWPAPLADAMLAVLARARAVPYPDPAIYRLFHEAAAAIPPARAGDFADAATYAEQLRPTLVEALDRLRLRERIHAAFAALPPPGSPPLEARP